MVIRILAFILLSGIAPLLALVPAERVSENVTLYVEGSPLGQGLTALRSIVSSVAGEGVWSMMSANLEERSGVNLLDAAKLEGIGVDTKSPWGFATNTDIATAGNSAKTDFVILLPSKASDKLYDFLKAKVGQSKMTINTEEEPGQLLHFGSENDPGYILKSSDAVLVGNKLDLVKSAASHVSSPIANATYYTAMHDHLVSRNSGKLPLAAFYLNPKLIVDSVKTQSALINDLQRELTGNPADAAAIDENSPYVAEIRDNLQSMGGALIVTKKRIAMHIAYKYKDGYLADTSKYYPRILQVKAQPLSSDTLASTPVHYSMLKLNIMGIIELLKTMSPAFSKKYQETLDKMKAKTNIEMEKQVFAALRGNFNFQILGIPPEAKMKDFTAWQLNGSYGIRSGTSDNWLKVFKAIEAITRKREAALKSKNRTVFAYDEADEGNFVTIKSNERIAGKTKPVSIVVLIRDDEIVVANSKTNALKAINGSKTPLSQRLVNLSYANTQGIFFLDLQQILKAVAKSKSAAPLKNYTQILENLKYFSIVSSIQGDFATAESAIDLKK